MIRRLLPLLLLASIASASTRTVDSGARMPDGGTVSGIVSSVSGNLIRLADGLITIDTTGARISGHSPIEPGMIVFASLATTNVAPNAPLPAATVNATRLPDATLFGPVQSVDPAAKTIALLGRTIRVTDQTSFGGILRRHDGPAPGLADILPNQLVQVHVDATGGQLVATTVLVLAPTVPEVHATRGTVKSIGTDAWVIDRERGDEITLAIDAQTKIAGSPKVGDTVEVLYRVDSSHANVAISIIKFERPTPPPVVDLFRFSGKVKSIASHQWTIARESGDQRVAIDSHSRIEPGIAVGDTVEVLAQRKQDGAVVALAIVRRR